MSVPRASNIVLSLLTVSAFLFAGCGQKSQEPAPGEEPAIRETTPEQLTLPPDVRERIREGVQELIPQKVPETDQ